MMSLEALLKEGTKVLEEHELQEARLDAWLLLEYVTGMNRAFYFAHSADGIEEEKADRCPLAGIEFCFFYGCAYDLLFSQRSWFPL